ncbi:flagellar assembly protein FliH [Scopulibacillus darangshiensis]|uniref:flagellar assembly protein FliH n=1 Tax=Scopulibacillus darangshiensis TaxID=442528 RepID=UPI001404618B|nr:flagellar assembly protein FliH [Scopulibacillus darangshiensis]
MSNVIKAPASMYRKRVLDIHSVNPRHLYGAEEHNNMTDRLELTLSERVRMARNEANDIIAGAQADYERKQQDIKRQEEQLIEKSDVIYKEQHALGYQDGFKKGQDEGLASCCDKLKEANSIVRRAETAYKEYLQQAEPQILSLAIMAAETIMNTTLSSEPEQWLPIIKKVLGEVREMETIKIIVPPVWFPVVNDQREELAAYAQGAQLLVFVDGDLNENKCYIETPFGKIDASIDSQLRVLKAKLLELLEETK